MEVVLKRIQDSTLPIALTDLYQQYPEQMKAEGITSSRSLLDRLAPLGYTICHQGNVVYISPPPTTRSEKRTMSTSMRTDVSKRSKGSDNQCEMISMNRQLIEMNQSLIELVSQKDEQINLLTNRIQDLTLEVKELRQLTNEVLELRQDLISTKQLVTQCNQDVISTKELVSQGNDQVNDLRKKVMSNFDNINKIIDYHDLYTNARKVAKWW
jgi:hypothetical protein